VEYPYVLVTEKTDIFDITDTLRTTGYVRATRGNCGLLLLVGLPIFHSQRERDSVVKHKRTGTTPEH